MATPYRNVGAIESTGALASTTDQTGAAMDYDAVNGYAQITAKASGVGASLGLRFRALVAGALTVLLSFAPGSTTAAFAGGMSVAGSTSLQAVTATAATVSASSGNDVTVTLNQIGITAWTVTNRATSGLLAISQGGNDWLTIAKTTGATNLASSLTIANGLTVSASGIMVNAGTSTFQTISVTGSRALQGTSQVNAVGAQTATMTNAPTAGNPAFWLAVHINGTDYAIPCWVG